MYVLDNIVSFTCISYTLIKPEIILEFLHTPHVGLASVFVLLYQLLRQYLYFCIRKQVKPEIILERNKYLHAQHVGLSPI